jgi:hypothetical protein
MGSLFILDLDGNPTKAFTNLHSASVCDVDVDSSCEWVATASDDGKNAHF